MKGREEMKESEEKKAIIEKLMKDGKTYKQISEETGIPYGTVGIYGGKINKAKRKSKYPNGDRHLCSGRCSWLDFAFAVDFPMVKWSDSEPWLIEDLKKLEVVDSYE